MALDNTHMADSTPSYSVISKDMIWNLAYLSNFLLSSQNCKKYAN